MNPGGNCGNPCNLHARIDDHGRPTGTKSVHQKQSSYSYDDLIRCSRGELFGPENARLPAPNMLMFDRISEIRDEGGDYGRGYINAELDIRPDLWFFNCHFIEDPVMPGCLGLDALWQLGGFFLVWSGHTGKGRALGAGSVKFTGQVLPSARQVSYRLDIRRIISRKLSLVICNGRMSVDGRQIYVADDLRIGLFESTEGF